MHICYESKNAEAQTFTAYETHPGTLFPALIIHA